MSSTPRASVRLLPLGGLGEIGMNCLALEQQDEILVVDCGVAFPHDDLGVDVIHPDFSWLVERADRVVGLILTHGHEDHIGAVPYLLARVPVPVFGPPHAIGLVKHRLAEHPLAPGKVDLRTIVAGHTSKFGDFVIEPIRVAHSIVEATALRIETTAGTILHTGDFNFDAAPPDGEPTDVSRLESVAGSGVGLLLSDSTNIDVPEKTHGEREVGVALEAVVEAARGRVIIALFASNIQRLMMLGAIAQRTRRKICVLGRSLRTQVEVATEIGRLDWPSDLVVPPELAKTLPRDALLILAGGTQGEPNSAMARLAAGTHQDFDVGEGDTVVMSSRIIPGNDRPVFAMMGNVLRTGATLCTRVTDPHIHTSGHATRAEQRRMIELVRPRCFMPVHGTLHHLRRHAELAKECGIEERIVVENGSSVVFDGERLTAGERFASGAVHVGMGGKPLSSETLKQRAEMARSGVATLTLTLDSDERVVAGPELSFRGVQGVESAHGAVKAVLRDVARHTERARRRVPDAVLVEDLRRLVRRGLEPIAGARPVVDVVLSRCCD